MSSIRVVVIGGTGNFGARICRRLVDEEGIELVATSRAGVDAPHARVGSAALDIAAPGFAHDLRALTPDVVVHCAGPYQGQDYRVARASLAAHAHYIDLADGRDFVAQFAASNDRAARDANRAAISGASTLPALSSAVVDALSQRFDRIDTIEIAIAPGQRAPRGAATMAAVLGYAGAPFAWWSDGRWSTAYGWQELRRIRFPFGRRYAAACDVPDLALFPERYRGVRGVTFHAALEVAFQHFGLWCIGAVRRLGIPLPIARWSGPLNRIGTWLDRFGSECGGMRVSVTGDDSQRRATWYAVAPDNHGPEIPCMATTLLVSKIATGEAVPAGARACVGMLRLSEFAPEFSRWGISTWIEEADW